MGDRPDQTITVEGVPVWMEEPLNRWGARFLYGYPGKGSHVGAFGEDTSVDDLLLRWNMTTRSSRPIKLSRDSAALWGCLLREYSGEIFNLIDFFLFEAKRNADHFWLYDHAVELEEILKQSGSTWQVIDVGSRPRLRRRLMEPVALLVEEANECESNSAAILMEAFSAQFGVSPDPEKAYSKAVQAIEAACVEKVLPRDSKATLGKVLAHLRDRPKGWQLPLTGRQDDSSLLGYMLEAVWDGQTSRHGGNGSAKPSEAESETAVLLALVVVQAFESDLVFKSDS